jgi:hypothetical protein
MQVLSTRSVSSDKSAISFFRPAFAYSSCFNRRLSVGGSPSNFVFQVK